MTKKVFSTEAMKKDLAKMYATRIAYTEESRREEVIFQSLCSMFEFAHGSDGWTMNAEGKTDEESGQVTPANWCIEVEYEEDEK